MEAGIKPDTFRKVHKVLSGERIKDIKDIKDMASKLQERMLSNGETRETSLAITKLEESIFWVTKHLSR
jgi:hypothetical protein